MVGRMGGREESSRPDIYLKLKLPFMSIPILASVGFRKLPSASVRFRRLPSLPCTSLAKYIYILRSLDNMVGGMGARKPDRMSRYLAKIEVAISAYPNYSFRQLPSASASFRGIPWTSFSAYIGAFRQHGRWEGGWKPNFTGRYLSKIRGLSAASPNFSFRQPPSASAGFRGQIAFGI